MMIWNGREWQEQQAPPPPPPPQAWNGTFNYSQGASAVEGASSNGFYGSSQQPFQQQQSFQHGNYNALQRQQQPLQYHHPQQQQNLHHSYHNAAYQAIQHPVQPHHAQHQATARTNIPPALPTSTVPWNSHAGTSHASSVQINAQHPPPSRYTPPPPPHPSASSWLPPPPPAAAAATSHNAAFHQANHPDEHKLNHSMQLPPNSSTVPAPLHQALPSTAATMQQLLPPPPPNESRWQPHSSATNSYYLGFPLPLSLPTPPKPIIGPCSSVEAIGHSIVNKEEVLPKQPPLPKQQQSLSASSTLSPPPVPSYASKTTSIGKKKKTRRSGKKRRERAASTPLTNQGPLKSPLGNAATRGSETVNDASVIVPPQKQQLHVQHAAELSKRDDIAVTNDPLQFLDADEPLLDDSKQTAAVTMEQASVATSNLPASTAHERNDSCSVDQVHLQQLEDIVFECIEHRKDDYKSQVQHALDTFRLSNVNTLNHPVPKDVEILADLAAAVIRNAPHKLQFKKKRWYLDAKRACTSLNAPVATASSCPAIDDITLQHRSKSNILKSSDSVKHVSLDNASIREKRILGSNVQLNSTFDAAETDTSAAAASRSGNEPPKPNIMSTTNRSMAKAELAKAQAKLREALQEKKQFLQARKMSLDRKQLLSTPDHSKYKSLRGSTDSLLIKNIDTTDEKTCFLEVAKLLPAAKPNAKDASHELLLKRKLELENALARAKEKRRRLTERNTSDVTEKSTGNEAAHVIDNCNVQEPSSHETFAVSAVAAAAAAAIPPPSAPSRDELLQRRKELERKSTLLHFQNLVAKQRDELAIQTKELDETEQLLAQAEPELAEKMALSRALDQDVVSLAARRDVVHEKLTESVGQLVDLRRRKHELMAEGTH
ncbi:hypothetical protein MPSEU_000769000 [Mayamaea pseudoterrestris]|nr:hypothetical protein MPSEU_000769000 [Mayamaea pseudoterrestris]